jgi:hypothetical protein
MSAMLFDLSDWSQIELTGSDRQSFLNGFCTNDVKKLQPGQGCEAFMANIKGRIIGHLKVYAHENRLSLESEPGQAAAIIGHLDKYLIAEDVQLVDRTSDWGLLLIAGEGASDVLQSSGLCPSPPQQIGAHVESMEGSRASVRRCDIVREPCWTISIDRKDLDKAKSRLIAAGAALADDPTFNSMRIEHGYPLFSVDLTEENLVHESARVPQTVSFTKGCYLGQEPIARLDSLGHVNRHLCRLRISTTSPIPARARLLQSAEGAATEVGEVTSAAQLCSSADQSDWGAIALVKRDAALPGTQLLVDLGNSVTVESTVLAPE